MVQRQRGGPALTCGRTGGTGTPGAFESGSDGRSLSIYQTDIIVYGTDLADYIDNEFGGSGWAISPEWRPPAG